MPRPVIVGEVGSIAHGLGVAQSDHDYHGVYVDPPEALMGLKPLQGSVKFGDKAIGVKTAAGESEGMLYGLRKFAALCAQGNPTVLTLLFTPVLTVPDDVIYLQENRDLFLSRRLAARHMGYADSMYRRLTGDLAPRTNRPELIAKHGYDTKAAFHALRLLIQGHELLSHRTMTMPMNQFAVSHLMAVRNGEVQQDKVLEQIRVWRQAIQDAEKNSPLPEHPDMDAINDYLVGVHRKVWREDREDVSR